jgi:hypothetical protein
MRKPFVVPMMVAAVVFLANSTARADGKFSLKSIRGTYGFSASGTLRGFPAAAVGLNSFDGKGGCAISVQLNSLAVGGLIHMDTIACTYTVNADGTGVINSTFPIGMFRSDIVIINDDEVDFVLSNSIPGDVVASGVAKRQRGKVE